MQNNNSKMHDAPLGPTVWVRALVGAILLCSWVRHYYHCAFLQPGVLMGKGKCIDWLAGPFGSNRSLSYQVKTEKQI